MTKAELQRQQRNKELLEAMKDPNAKLSSFSKDQSWWPKRKIIEKDLIEIEKLYGEKEQIRGEE